MLCPAPSVCMRIFDTLLIVFVSWNVGMEPSAGLVVCHKAFPFFGCPGIETLSSSRRFVPHCVTDPRKIKDYIQRPKENGYQSLHTIGQANTRVIITNTSWKRRLRPGIGEGFVRRRLRARGHPATKEATARLLRRSFSYPGFLSTFPWSISVLASFAFDAWAYRILVLIVGPSSSCRP